MRKPKTLDVVETVVAEWPSADAGAQITQAVEDALARGDCDEASRLAAGHPKPQEHVKLMERIHVVRSGAEKAQADPGPAQPPGADADADLPRNSAGLRMFALNRRAALLKSFNPRAEKHGQESMPAADLAFEANLSSEVLAAFHNELRGALFCKIGRRSDLVDEIHDAPDLRFERLGLPVKWTARYAGYTLRVHPTVIEDDPDRDIVLTDVDINNITFAPQQGGTVIVGWRAQFHPNESAAGRLAMLVQTRVDVTLIPPEDGGEIIDDGEGEE